MPGYHVLSAPAPPWRASHAWAPSLAFVWHALRLRLASPLARASSSAPSPVARCSAARTEPLPSRWRGKQFAVAHPKKLSATQDGLFGKSTHPAKDEYVEAVPKKVPMNKRKLGFGVRNPNERDEFTNTISTERYRERLRREMRSIDQNIEATAASMGVTAAAAAAPGAAEPAGTGAASATSTLGFSMSARGTARGPPRFMQGAYEDALLGKSTPRHSEVERQYGSMKPTSSEYGQALEGPPEKPKFGLKTASTAFYDIGHLGQ